MNNQVFECDKDCPVKKYCRKHIEDNRLFKFGYYKPLKHCHYESCTRCANLVEIVVYSDYYYPGALCKSKISGRDSTVANSWNKLYRCWSYEPNLQLDQELQLRLF